MALKFLNKKGWHTGSLRNIENVWKAEQKHDAEQKKLDELRKQIQEERERSEFRLLQEQAGLVPKQERLDFLYDSGLAVGKGSSDGFKALEALPKTDPPQTASSSSSAKQQPSMPGALFEEKPQSANDAWRKLHSDPLLLIRQREQDALARVKNNPVQMAMIRKSVEAKNDKEKTSESKKREKRHHKKSKHQKRPSSERQSDSDDVDGEEEDRKRSRKRSNRDEHSDKLPPCSGRELNERNIQRKRNIHEDTGYKVQPACALLDSTTDNDDTQDGSKRNYDKAKRDKYYVEDQSDRKGREDRRAGIHGCSDYDKAKRDKYYLVEQSDRKGREERRAGIRDSFNYDKEKHDKYYVEDQSDRKVREDRLSGILDSSDIEPRRESHQKRRNAPLKLSEEERAARLQEMQMDAELHEAQRWKRLKKADENDAREALSVQHRSSSSNFLDAAQKSIYGAEKGGSSTIEESVRRRTHYSQRRSDACEGNAFRR